MEAVTMTKSLKFHRPHRRSVGSVLQKQIDKINLPW